MRFQVCNVTELLPGTTRVVSAGQREVVVFNLDGELVAIDNRCAHKEQPLDEGVVRDGVLTCPAHLWRFNLRTGERTDSPGWRVACYPVSVVDGEIVVDVPEPEEPKSIRDQLLEHARDWNRDA